MEETGYKEEYLRRIHKVQDYIEHHLGCSISVEKLSEVAGFSMYHFSRIFQAVMQETIAHYVNRIRLEQSLFLLAHRKDKNMTDIAYEMGFSDSAVFSRAFKNYYGISPKEYRQEYSKNCKEIHLLSDYNGNTAKEEQALTALSEKVQITLENLGEQQLAYVRHIGTYQSLAAEYPVLLEQLFTHAQEQKLLRNRENQVLSIYHDNPEFSDQNQFRTSMCITVPEDISIREDGVLGRMILEGGLYAVGHFKIPEEQYRSAWDYMYREWLTGSGYVPRNYNPFEVYCNNPAEEQDHINYVDIYVPVEPILL